MKKILALAIAFLIILAACGNHSNHEHHSHEGKLKVVTTNSILYDMVKRVGGNKV
ncbi:MAG: metal ABC transporter substrate-binding protein, partial [Staphylococcus epidermidis]|nr:metal ABC transporter substrate-binding protein [Staphylococcus epidermidis]